MEARLRAWHKPDDWLAWIDDRLSRGGNPARDGWRAGAVLLGPAALIIVAFALLPIGASLYLSFFDGRYIRGDFIGLGNYREALTSPDFWNSVLVTVYYLVGTIPATLLIGYGIARLLLGVTRGRVFFKTLYFLPYITSAYAAALVWRAMLNPQTGLANRVLVWMGLSAQQWLMEPRGLLHIVTAGLVPDDFGPSLALCCVMAFDVWHGLGFTVVILLAGLASIPRELEESARIDGASAWQVNRHVTLPMLSPTLYFLAVVGTIKGFQAFNSFYALTQSGGNTLGTTENMVLYLFANFYEFGRWGYSAAIAALLLFAIIGLTVVQARVARRWVYYE
jgi:multiple sugar transport system permease protein